VDFSEDEDLARAVREGRRREFAHFKSFAEQHGGETIPDPTLPETFERSRPDWREADRAPHAEARAQTEALLRLRHAEIVPVTKTRFLGAGAFAPAPEVVDVVWRYEGGSLRFVANFGHGPVEVETDGAATVLWASRGADQGGPRATLPGWTGLFMKGPPA
jgi:maltooligosyltrehalose trehalohydrolase